MTSPPGTAPTPMPRVEHISAESDLSTRTQQMRFLVAELGITRQQAHRLIKAYEADLAEERAAYLAAAHRAARQDAGVYSFRNWVALMTAVPLGATRGECAYARSVRKPRGVEAR